MGGQQATHQGEHTGSVTVQSQDLANLSVWHFVCQVPQHGVRSGAFVVRGIDIKEVYERTALDITPQVTANTGLVPVEERLDDYDALPDRISHWLEHNEPPTTQL